MVDGNENDDSLNLEDEAVVTEEETTSSEETAGEPEPINLAKLTVEDLEGMDESRRLEASRLLLEANRKLYARTQKPKESPKAQPTNSGVDKEVPEWGKQLQTESLKRQFGYENNLSPEETDAVFRINPRPTKDTLKDPFIKGGLDAIKRKNRVENATPSSSGRTATFNGKQLHEMDDKEATKNYADVIKQAVDRRK